ncbi:MAG: hypothetical protein J6I74_02040 [Schwartzia sp.]|nr:hypothetical protein [Schwartzia sp. (in: firmicutes)]
MKKTMMAVAMAAMTMMASGTALAATPERGNFQDSTTRVEMSYAHCGGGYYGGGRGGRGGYGCDGYERGHRGGYGGYCWGNEDNEG